MEYVDIGPSRVMVLPVVRGLVSEEAKVEDAFEKCSPGAVALSISKEEAESLKILEKEEAPLETPEEEVYVENLRKFGEVRKPPPCFSKAVNLCKESSVECVGADMTEEEYTDAYCHFISTLEVMRDSWFKAKLDKKSLEAKTPEEFVLKFDSIVNKTKGHKGLEREREKVMAHKIWKLSKKQRMILAIIELERANGVVSELKKKRK
jgi:hypothetical protein